MESGAFAGPAEWTEADYARNRRVGRVAYSKRFPCPQKYAAHADRIDTNTRIAWSVVESTGELTLSGTSDDGYEVVLRETEKYRQQLKAVFFEDDRHVCQLYLQRLSSDGKSLSTAFILRDQEIERLHGLLHMISVMEMPREEGDRIDLSLLERALATPEAWLRVYEQHPDELADLIRNDVSADDILALGKRRQQLEVFRRMLQEPQFFEGLMAEQPAKKPEDLWQAFFERNHWIFGLGLGSQLVLAWQKDKLETTVRGYSTATKGKRVDALMRTAGAMSGLAFVEIKLPTSRLIETYKAYRGDAYVPGRHVVGGVSQVHATVDAALEVWHKKLESEDDHGFKGEDVAYTVRPRSYLIVGSLTEFVEGGNRVAEGPYRSFENYRRSLSDPEIITYDELFERARYILADAERSQKGE